MLAVFKMGWVAQFLSRAVVTGFLFGAAIDVVIGELPKITGTDVTGSNSFQELRSWLGSLGDTNTATVVVGVVSLVVVFGLRSVVARTCRVHWCSSSAGCSRRTCSTSTTTAWLSSETSRAASRPSRSPTSSLMVDHAGTVAVAAVALMLIGFSQTAGDARAFAAKHRYQIDVDQESLAQSAANIGSGVLHGMPVSTSLSASSLNDHSGARTGLASITSGVTVLLTLLVLAPLFSQLPKPVLGALIIEAVVMGMMNLPEMRRMYRVKRFDFWIAVAAIIGTLAFGVLAGVVIGIGLSLLWLVGVATQPQMPILGREPGTQVFRDVLDNPDDELVPGVVVVQARRWPVLRHRGCPRGPGPRPLIQAEPRRARRRASTARASTSSTPRDRPRSTTCARPLHAGRRRPSGWPASSPTSAPCSTAKASSSGSERDHLHGNVHRAVEAQLGQ